MIKLDVVKCRNGCSTFMTIAYFQLFRNNIIVIAPRGGHELATTTSVTTINGMSQYW
jgi:hypothetical protein